MASQAGPAGAETQGDRPPRAAAPRAAGGLRRRLRQALSLLFLAAAGWLLWRALSGVTPAAVLRALAATPPLAVVASLALTAGSYLCLSVTEWLSLSALRHRLSFRSAARVAVPAYALTNSAGFSPVTGTALRLQLYRRDGLDARQAAAVAMLAGAAVTLSGVVTLGLALAIAPAPLDAVIGGPDWAPRAAAGVLLVPAILWFVAFRPGAPRWLGGARPAALPPARRALGLAAGVGDWLFSGLALFMLIGSGQAGMLPGFMAAFVAGCLLSAASGVPGGLGVFEAVVLSLTAVLAHVHETAAALLIYRVIYSLLPLTLLGAASLVGRLARRAKAARP
jgi:phosphatidylglycerol lysyltransferase